MSTSKKIGKRLYTNVSDEIAAKIENMAKEQKRSISQMIYILLEEKLNQ